jgi:hypothetical protein
MVVLNKPIEVIAHFDKNGMPRPYRFRIKDNEGTLAVYIVDKVLFRKREAINKQTFIIVRCKGNIQDIMIEYELKFDIQNTTWTFNCM